MDAEPCPRKGTHSTAPDTTSQKSCRKVRITHPARLSGESFAMDEICCELVLLIRTMSRADTLRASFELVNSGLALALAVFSKGEVRASTLSMVMRVGHQGLPEVRENGGGGRRARGGAVICFQGQRPLCIPILVLCKITED